MEEKVIEIEEEITVRKLATLLKVPVSVLIKALMKNGILATINQTIDWETASIIASDFGYEVKLKSQKEAKISLKTDTKERRNLSPRPPIVTVMGHIDHGKTTLLEKLRKTEMVKHEIGGITQHIGAYQIDFKGKKITFIDTPGHEAFEEMRRHGANITDIVVLVVAADEGVKPQTVEAVRHAKEAKVPIIVAINKIDLPNANIQMTKNQLVEIGLVPEEMGGDTVCVPISAKKMENLDELLEMILIVAELKGFKADLTKPASGVIIDSKLDPKLGPIASVLIQEGVLRVGDFFITEQSWGRVRFMENEYKKRIEEATPSLPVRIGGFKDLPDFGEIFQVVYDKKTAETLSSEFRKRKLQAQRTKTDKESIPIIIKADASASLKAVLNNIKKLDSEKVSFSVISEGIGNISEDDVMLASTTGSIICGFRVKVFSTAEKLAQLKKVKIFCFDIIYELMQKLTELIQLKIKEGQSTKVGSCEILKVFGIKEGNQIIGGKVIDGFIERGLPLIIKRDGKEIAKGRLRSLQVGKEKRNRVEKDALVGLGVDSEVEIQENDVLEFYNFLPKE